MAMAKFNKKGFKQMLFCFKHVLRLRVCRFVAFVAAVTAAAADDDDDGDGDREKKIMGSFVAENFLTMRFFSQLRLILYTYKPTGS